MKILSLIKATSFLLITSILISCASAFAPRYQKVTINKGQGTELLIDGEKPERKKGQIILDKKRGGVQLTAKKNGFKDENIVVGTYKNHVLKYALTLPLSLLYFGMPMALDKGFRSKKFDKTFTIGKNLVPVPKRKEGEKEIRLNKVSAEIDADNIEERYFYSFKKYYRKSSKKKSKKLDVESINLKNTIFTELFNDILRKNGYIDTTKKALKNSYSNNLLLNASIKGMTFHRVSYDRMLYADITIDWEVLDYYKKAVYTKTTTSTSGQFAGPGDFRSYSSGSISVLAIKAIQDAMEFGLIEFLAEDEIKKLLMDRSVSKQEESFKPISIPKSNKYASSISDAVSSGVTIKGDKGHGSGFIISEEGHIITNYHVLAQMEDMQVITNDGEKFDFEIIRESKVHDLALIKIDADNLVPLKLSKSKDPELGSTVYAIGTPSSESLSQTVSKGIISGIRKSDINTNIIQTDVSINSGNSGGALVDKNGTVLGVVSSKLVGFGIEGVAFCIPANDLYDKLKLE